VTARRADRLKQLEQAVHALPQPHGDILTLVGDVRDAVAIQSAVSLAVKRFGRLDVLVANAGVGQRGSIVDSIWEHVETLLRTNIDGVLHSIRAAVPEMRKSGGGHIIVISSVVANMTAPYAASYSASKAFVSSIARSLRLELEPDNIRVTEMLLGRTESEFNKKRLGQAGYASNAPRLPVMPVEKAAKAIVKASRQRRKTVLLRPFDRLVVLVNSLFPEMVGRRALRQYKT
jgi:short-subunit dehydrogenase